MKKLMLILYLFLPFTTLSSHIFLIREDNQNDQTIPTLVLEDEFIPMDIEPAKPLPKVSIIKNQCTAALESREGDKKVLALNVISSMFLYGMNLEAEASIAINPKAVLLVLSDSLEMPLTNLLEYVYRKNLTFKERALYHKKDLAAGFTEDDLNASEFLCEQFIRIFFNDCLFDDENSYPLIFSTMKEEMRLGQRYLCIYADPASL